MSCSKSFMVRLYRVMLKLQQTHQVRVDRGSIEVIVRDPVVDLIADIWNFAHPEEKP